jgi:single-strand DNA-binding protein
MTNATDPAEDENQVVLRGRLAAEPVLRTLPSGDELCTFRITVRRPPDSRAAVDSIDCVTARARVRRTVFAAVPGTTIAVTGRLHRRFWRTPAGPASRYEVEVATIRVTARRRSGASSGRTPASA